MRIILAIFAGLLLGFLLGQVLLQTRKKIPFLKKLLPIHYSLPGLGLIITGIMINILGFPDPIKLLTGYFLASLGLGLVFHHLLAQAYILSEDFEHSFFYQHQKGMERFLEILPGALTWLALTSPFWLSFTLPFAVAYLIVLADIYWLINSLKIALFIYLGYRKMKYAKEINWLEKLQSDFPKDWPSYYHLIVLPTFKESLAVLKSSFDAVVASSYPAKKIFLAVGFEERDDPQKIEECQAYLETISAQIGGIFTTVHPFGLAKEVPGPGSNRNYIVQNAVNKLAQLNIKPEQVFITTLDADFVIHPQFLAGALHKYLSTPPKERDKRSYTGTFFYYNNYWQTSTPMRLIASGTAFWQLAEMYGSDKYINFSSLSINLKSLLDIGLWIPDKVNDDSGFFWKAYFYYKGNYKVIPHYLPIFADAVLDVSLLKTLQNQYLQQKRWAYGVEHIPFIFEEYFKNKDMNFWDKTDKLFFALWGYLKWGTLALFVSFAGLIIPLINPYYNQSVVAYNLPVVSSWILTLAFAGIFATIYVHEKTVPKRPSNWSFHKKLWSYIQWVLVPLVLVTISTVPAIDAQTSLMLGKYLEFRVTNKARLR